MKYEKTREAMEKLTPEQFRVTQENGTERPHTGALTGNKDPGIYVDIVSGEPLFASSDKYESGCGWPSFTKPIVTEYVTEHEDGGHGMVRTEGPPDRGGLRYCINSASMRFVHRDDMETEGYGDFLDQVEEIG